MEKAIDKRKEIISLANRYGQPQIVDAVLPNNYLSSVTSSGRESEVVSAIMRPNNKLISITKPFYPEGTYRLPSGGIEKGERIESALHREIYEETGLDVEIVEFVAIIRYSTRTTMFHNFTSYVFLVNEIGGDLVCNDPDEQISEFKEITAEELKNIVTHLRNIRGRFESWAQFRAVAHKAVLNYYL